MSKLPTKLVIAILAIGILLAATTTVMSANLAQAQVPIQQQALAPAAASPPPLTGASFGPNCAGCISNQNLANGAVTTQKIAPGAVSITTSNVVSFSPLVPPGGTSIAVAFCPPGTVVTGGGFGNTGSIFTITSSEASNGRWSVSAFNNTPNTSAMFSAMVICASIHP